MAYAQTQDDNRLSSLTVTGVSISPSFNRDTLIYSARVPNTKENVVVRATASNRGSMVTIGMVIPQKGQAPKRCLS